MEIGKGELVGLIGPNGAGKTTVFNTITGIYRCNSGEIVFKGEDIRGCKTHEIAKRGIARTFQATNLFGSISVLENIMMGSYLHSGLGGFDSFFPNPRSRMRETRVKGEMIEILHLLGMDEVLHTTSKDLPHKHQKLLQIGIALACKPELLLLDEPVAGMNLEEIHFTMEFISKIKGLGVSILLVEHNMKAVMSYCERIVVLDHGQKIAEGIPEEVKRNEKVINAYLGSSEFIA